MDNELLMNGGFMDILQLNSF